MKLKNRYACGVLVMFYEIEMFLTDFVDGILNMIKNIENPENIILDIYFSTDEYFEEIDTDKISIDDLYSKFDKGVEKLTSIGITVNTHGKYIKYKYMEYPGHEPKSIAWYRRNFTYRYTNDVDFIMWGETDSFFPSQAFEVLEQISEYAESQNIFRYVVSFAYRKMWDGGWKILEHPEFTNVKYIDKPEWITNNIASEKCYMSIDQMNEINNKYADSGYEIFPLREPKFDGSCVVFSTELIKTGIVLPHCLLMSGEDTSFAHLAKKIMGDNYIQFHIKNLLRVHNRRHHNKRLYIKNENNPTGNCGSNKGMWWKIMEQMSKSNLSKLDIPNQKYYTWKDFFKEINK